MQYCFSYLRKAAKKLFWPFFLLSFLSQWPLKCIGVQAGCACTRSAVERCRLLYAMIPVWKVQHIGLNGGRGISIISVFQRCFLMLLFELDVERHFQSHSLFQKYLAGMEKGGGVTDCKRLRQSFCQPVGERLFARINFKGFH